MTDANNHETRTTPQWTVLSLLQWATEYLGERGCDEARLHVELLLSRVLNLPRIGLYTHFDRPMSADELAGFKSMFRRRLAHEPVQYILGEASFMGLTFHLTPAVLIPRPETELLVERALGLLPPAGEERSALDIGTGSGNIAVALAVMRPGTRVTAIDISPEALAVATRNAIRHGVATIRFEQADVFEEFLSAERFDVVVSNPPYVSAADFDALPPEIREYEPRIATTDNEDGFRFIRRLAQVAMDRLTTGGRLLVEIGFGQKDRTVQIFTESGLSSVEVFDDYARIPRIAMGTKL